jgi:DNA-binding transcriptional ArsR family regulator
MPQVPDVGVIADQIKSRIAHIEEQLEEHRKLTDELERLRAALSRLEGDGSGGARGRRRTAARAPGTRRTPTAAATPDGGAGGRRRRTAPRGQTRARVLEALGGGPKTAGEVSEATGIPRASASTTLNKLTKTGEVEKAERGYRLRA